VLEIKSSFTPQLIIALKCRADSRHSLHRLCAERRAGFYPKLRHYVPADFTTT